MSSVKHTGIAEISTCCQSSKPGSNDDNVKGLSSRFWNNVAWGDDHAFTTQAFLKRCILLEVVSINTRHDCGNTVTVFPPQVMILSEDIQEIAHLSMLGPIRKDKLRQTLSQDAKPSTATRAAYVINVTKELVFSK